jgi:hypothetical protein
MTRTVYLDPGEDVIVYGEKLTHTKLTAARNRIRIKDNRSAPTEQPPPPPPPPPPDPEPEPEPPTGATIGPDVTGLPMSGSAWDYVKSTAASSWGSPALTMNQDNRHGVKALAGAMYFARTGDATMRAKVVTAIKAVVAAGSPSDENAILSMGRQLGSYVLAADYIGLDGADDAAFRAWLSPLRTAAVGTHGRYKALRQTAYDSPHNWGTFAFASLLAADLYRGDAAMVEQDWKVYKGFCGDRASYAGFQQIDPTKSGGWGCPGQPFTPFNSGCPTDAIRFGAIVKDVMRGGAYPNPSGDGIGYMGECLQGLALSAELFLRAGKTDAWSRVRPAFEWGAKYDAIDEGQVDQHVVWIANRRLGLNRATKPAGFGRVWGYTDWLYA